MGKETEMTFEEYQKEAVKFRLESANNENYLTLGLIAEVGEAAGKLAKQIRDGVFDEKAFIKELGDILWFVANLTDFYDKEYDLADSKVLSKAKCFDYRPKPEEDWKLPLQLASICCNVYEFSPLDIVYGIAQLAAKFGYTLEQVAEINLAKLRSRANRGVIQGDGDER